jgi:hypothetical protein
LHYRLHVRPVAGRSWFSTNSSITFSLALAGQGYVRVTKTVSGSTTEVNVGGTAGFSLTEADWLDQGYRFTDVLTLSAGDVIDIYYIQDREQWGGLVAKVVQGTVRSNALAARGPVAGCGLFDSSTQPPTNTWDHVERVQVTVDTGGAPQAVLTIPLLNPAAMTDLGGNGSRIQLTIPDTSRFGMAGFSPSRFAGVV